MQKKLLPGLILAISYLFYCGSSANNNNTPTYTIGGTAYGLTGPVTLQNNGSGNLTISADGAYRFSSPLNNNASFKVTISNSPSGDLCYVSNAEGSISSANIANINVYCRKPGGNVLPTGSLNTARAGGHVSIQLDNGEILVTGGYNNASTIITSAEIYNPATGLWTATGSMNVARYLPTITKLNDGKILVTGGLDATSTRVNSAELYDPASQNWSLTGNMTTARGSHSAILLNNGKVLISGGSSDGINPLNSTEIFDPASGTFTAKANMNSTRHEHKMALLNNGDVLVIGGTTNTNGELYNVSGNTFTNTSGSVVATRRFPSVEVLNDSRVLIAGGGLAGTSTYLNTAEVYDPSTQTFTATGNMNVNRGLFPMVKLTNGTVTVFGGYVQSNGFGNPPTLNNSIQIFDPSDNTFTTVDTISTTRYWHTAHLLSDGSALVIGGMTGNNVPVSTVEIYNPNGQRFRYTGILAATPRAYHSAIKLPDDKVLLTGGRTTGHTPLTSAEIFDPLNNTFSTLANSMNVARANHKMELLNNKEVLIIGGTTNTAEIYNLETQTFTQIDNLNVSRNAFTTTKLQNGTILICGGHDGTTAVNSAELYDPDAKTFTPTSGSMATARYYHSATLLNNGKVLIAGGHNGTTQVDSFELFDPLTGNFTTLAATMTTQRSGHAAILMPDGNVLLLGGMNSAGTILTSIDRFNAGDNTNGAYGNMNFARMYFPVAVTYEGEVIIPGGFTNSGVYLTGVDHISNYAGATIGASNPLTFNRDFHTATRLGDGRILVTGGIVTTIYRNQAEIYY